MEKGIVSFRENRFYVEIVRSVSAKARGLSGRKSLGENEGMFFIFSSKWFHAFTMRGMKFPLDIIWLDKDYKVVDVKKNVEPCRGLFCPPLIPKTRAKYVLELNAGRTEKIGLKIGDALTVELEA